MIAVAYSDYRACNVPWVERIPAHWRTARLRYVARVGNGTTPARDRIDYWSNGTVPWLASGQVNDFIVRQAQQFITITAQKETSLRLLPAGSVIVGLYGQGKTRGTAAYLSVEATINQALAGITPGIELGGQFLHYMLIAGRDYLRNEGRGGSQPNLNCAIVGSFITLLPARAEQDQIVAYLRAQDAHIARFIKAKRELIGLLTEQKLRIIDHAVTRGLDASVALKPSGIEWLRHVPERWGTIHIGSSVQIVNGYPFDSGLFDAVIGHPLVRIRDLMRTDTEVKFNGAEVAEAVIDTGDLLVGMDGDFNAARWRGGRALLNQRMCCLRPRKQITTEYLSLVIPKALKFINDLTLSTTVKHLSSVDVKRLRFPVPGNAEQLEIVKWVATESAPLEAAIQRANDEIKLIREYRDRLIADVVTGRVDVRDWVPSPDDGVAEEDLGLLAGDEEIEPDGVEDGGEES